MRRMQKYLATSHYEYQWEVTLDNIQIIIKNSAVNTYVVS
jgi:hypothetical protein